MAAEYVYLLIEREFIHKNEPVYKIGQTKNLRTRIGAYPKNSKLVLSFIVNNCKEVERSIMKVFKEKFKQRRDIGTEYFEGHLEELKSAFEEIVLIENPKPSDQRSTTSDDHNLKRHRTSRTREFNMQCDLTLNAAENGLLNCECGYSCNRAYNLERHKQSKSHETNMMGMSMKSCLSGGNYVCSTCHFSTAFTTNFRKHLLSAKHKNKSSSPPVNLESEIKPVMLKEVMEMFFSHMKDESIQNRQFLKDESIQKKDLFKLFADRITAHEESIQHRGLQCVVQNAETVTNTINN